MPAPDRGEMRRLEKSPQILAIDAKLERVVAKILGQFDELAKRISSQKPKLIPA